MTQLDRDGWSEDALSSPDAPDGVVVAFPAGTPAVPGACPPDRMWIADSAGLPISVCEWGAPDDPPLALVHGAGDFARTFDLLAPLLAGGGWRVVAWDQRGHGDSGRAALYGWSADLRDAAAVLGTIADGPVPVVGHSRGGNLVVLLADSCPHLVSHVVNVDGCWSIAAAQCGERRRPPERFWASAPEQLARLLDRRLAAAGHAGPPATRATTPEALARRRHRATPRLSLDWCRYLVQAGARPGRRGWEWKTDPGAGLASMGLPFLSEWTLHGLFGLGQPVLAVVGLVDEGKVETGRSADDLRPVLPPGASVLEVAEAGHFVHLESPDLVADAILGFLR